MSSTSKHFVGRWTLVCFLSLVLESAAAATLVNFEQFNDSDQLTTQIPGLTFTSTEIWTAGISLNELELPPHSGSNVATDSGGPISIVLSSPASSFSAYVTYSVPLTLREFDSSNHLLGSAMSHFSSNLAISGDSGSSPNELLQITFFAPVAISRVTITGDPGGSSFVMDDISFQSAVPEPETCCLFIAGASALAVIAARRKA